MDNTDAYKSKACWEIELAAKSCACAWGLSRGAQEGFKRWFSDLEHLLLFQKTCVLVPAPT